jgi:signal transduction histidine kinase
MTLWPRSLFGRLSLTLIGVLVAAQLASLAIQFADRGTVLYRAVGLPLAQRVAEQVAVLDRLAPAQREEYLVRIGGSRQRVTLASRPTLEDSASGGWRGLLLRQLLQRELGDGYPLRLAIDEAAPGARHDPPRRMPHADTAAPPWMRHRLAEFGLPPRGAIQIRIEVGLHDGSQVLFTRLLTRDLFASPQPVLLGLGVLLLATLGVSLLAVRWLTRPLQHLAAAADRLGRDLNMPPLAESGPLEMQHAARAFNTMQRRLNRLVNDRARILAAISHDLKTPLTRLRLRAELLDDAEQQARIRADIDAMEELVNTTLDFMRDAAGDEPLQVTDIDALLGSLQADYEDSGHALDLEGHCRSPLAVRPQALGRCLVNLVDNALKYAGEARLVVADTPDRLEIIVRDAGPGIPDDQLEQVFEPFYRVEDSRSRETGGSGLGLSIARSVVRAHGGDLVLVNRPGGGLDAIVRLPRAQARQAARMAAGPT